MLRTRRLQVAVVGAGFAVTALLGALGTVYARDVYKWTDNNGQTHYSDKKPAGQKWQRVEGGNVSTIPTDAVQEPEASGKAPSDDSARQAVASAERAVAERREKLIQECEDNRGVDCARQVDTELGAQQIQSEGHVIHQARPPASIAPTGTAR